MHYRRWKATGSPHDVITVTHGPAEERFWRYVRVNEESGCWLWTGSSKGHRLKYPQFSTGQKESYAHRWSYQHFKGPIPEGLHVDHLCHQPLCVNPEHLETVTPTVNNQRRRVSLRR